MDTQSEAASSLAYASLAGLFLIMLGALLTYSIKSMDIKIGATIMAVGIFMAFANPAIRPRKVSETHWFLGMTALFGIVTWGAMHV